MKSRYASVFAIVMLLAMCVGGWTVLGQRESVTSTQWEYTVKHNGNTTEKTPAILNGFGMQGWELVTVTDDGWAYFKRQKK